MQRACALPLATVFFLAAVVYLGLGASSVVGGEAGGQAKGGEETEDPDIKDLLGGGDDRSDPTVGLTRSSSTAAPPPGSDEDDEPLDLLDHGEDEEEKRKKEEEEEEEKHSAEKKANASAPDTPEAVFLPEEGAAEKEHSNSLAIFFVLSVLVLCIFLVHLILRMKCHLLPESLVIIFLGAVIGLFMRLLPTEDMKSVESFSPTMFFLVLLPPIIFESGYNLHKGDWSLLIRYFYRFKKLFIVVRQLFR